MPGKRGDKIKKTGVKLLNSACMLFLLISLFAFTVSAEEVSLAGTGEEEAIISMPAQTIIPKGEINKSQAILWDQTHGMLSGLTLDATYRDLLELLQKKGYELNGTKHGVHSLNLSEYDILVVCLRSSWDTEYNQTEVDDIESFVENGGGLLIMGDHTLCPNVNINPVAQRFGTTLGTGDFSSYSPNNFSDHRILENISSVVYNGGGEIEATAPSEEVAWVWKRGAIAVVNDYGQGHGKVVVIGDTNFPDNSEISKGDNQLLIENIFDWLSTPAEPQAAPAVTINSPAAVINDSTPLLNASFDVVVSEAWYVLDENPGSEHINDTENLTGTLPELAEGTHNLTVYAKNAEGLTGEASLQFLLDISAPEITIGQLPTPAGPALRVNGTFTETGAGIASIVVNGVSATVNSEENSYSAAINLGNGENCVSVVATDRAGNSGTAETNVTVDSIPPALEIKSPQVGQRLWFVDNIVTGRVTDKNLESAFLIIKNEAGNVVSRYELLIRDNSFRERVEYAPSQNNSLELVAYDTAGNLNSTERTVYVENCTVRQELPSINESETVEIETVNETAARIEFVPEINVSAVNFTVHAITNKTAVDELNRSSSVFGEVALGKIVEVNVSGGVDGADESQVGTVRIYLYYNRADLDLDGNGEIGPGDLDEDTLFIYWYNETSESWTKLCKGGPEWVLDFGRARITGDGPGYVWIEVEHLSRYSLAGSLMTLTEIPEKTSGKTGGGSGTGSATIIKNNEENPVTGPDEENPEGTEEGKEGEGKEGEERENEGKGEEYAPEIIEIDKEVPAGSEETSGPEAEPIQDKALPGFGTAIAAAGLAISTIYLRRRML